MDKNLKIIVNYIIIISIIFIAIATSYLIHYTNVIELLKDPKNIQYLKIFAIAILFIIIITLICKKRKIGISELVNIIFKYRFAIIGIIFIILVIFNVHYSSIGIYNDYFNNQEHGILEGTIIGKPRPIRSDEWIVQTPYYLSQEHNNFSVINDNFANNGQNMLLSFCSPTLHISSIGNPFSWGYFISSSIGIAWSWNLKILVLLISTIEFIYILTKNKSLSLISGIIMVFSPFMQWWLSTVYITITAFAQAIIVIVYYLLNTKNTKIRLGLSVLLLICGIGFTIQLYPAFQIQFVYFILIFVIYYIYKFRKNIDKSLIIFIVSVLLIYGVIMGITYMDCKEAINITMNTAYPGQRRSLGGNFDIFNYINQNLFNWLMPYKDLGNPCEASTMYFLLPVIIIALPNMLFKAKNKKLYLALLIYTIITILWCTVEFPSWFGKITLFSLIPQKRMAAFTVMLLFYFTIMAVNNIFKEKDNDIKSKTIIKILMVIAYYIFAIIVNKEIGYLGFLGTVISLVIFISLSVQVILKNKKTFYTLLLLFSLISAATINPIVIGLSDIYKHNIIKEIGIISEREDGKWITVNGFELNNLILASGGKIINSVEMYPDLETWYKIDPEKKYEEIYNRYEHIIIALTEEETSFELLQGDLIKIYLNIGDIRKIDARYILSPVFLDEYNLENENFRILYLDETSGYKIYEYVGE